MQLSPEEKQRIYEEEKARLEAQKKIKDEEDQKQFWGCLALLIIFIIFGGIMTLIGKLLGY